MTIVKRIDFATSQPMKPVRTPEGWLRVDGFLTRTGIFPYMQADGTVRRELRLPEEVFSKESLDSFALAPVTDEHPDDFLDASNTHEHARGSVGVPKRDGEHVAAPMLITHSDLIAKLDAKEAREISCGYTCDLEMKSGTTPTGEKYDAIQRNIRGNHIAIVPRGRAGPTARVRMDGAAIGVLRNQAHDGGAARPTSENPPQPKDRRMAVTKKIDGVDVDFETESGSQTFARYEAKRDAEAEGLRKQLEELKTAKTTAEAQRDEAKASLAKKDEEIKALPEKLKGEAKERADLEAKARDVLGKKVDLSKLDAKGIRELCLDKLKVKLTDANKADGAYLAARFDAAYEALAEDEEEEAPSSKARKSLRPVKDADDEEEDDELEEDDEHADEEDELDEDEGDDDEEDRRGDRALDPDEKLEKARARMKKDHDNAWKIGLPGHSKKKSA